MTTGQEARDDGCEALIAEANRVCAPGIDRTGVGYEVGLIQRLADALTRKHPELEITDERVAAAVEEWWKHPDITGGLDCMRAALEAALRVPVGEGEKPVIWLGVSVTWPSGLPSEGIPLLDGASVEIEGDGLSNRDAFEILSTLALQHARAAIIEEADDETGSVDVEANARLMVIHEIMSQQVDAEPSS